MDMILKNTFQSISPAYELIGDVTVESNTTQVDFTELSIGKDDELLLVSDCVNVTSGSLKLFLNNNTTDANYYSQRLKADELVPTKIESASYNNSLYTINGDSASSKALSITSIKLTNIGHFAYQSNGIKLYGGNNTTIETMYGTSKFTVESMASIHAKHELTNGIGTGSRFQLYKLVAEKVADIIVPSNTTSVDITGLNIGKDGEYYLVSDVVSGAYSDYYLYANNNTTATNYYSQRLTAAGSIVNSARTNNPNMLNASSGNKSLIMSNIKLTNSGYLVSQNNSCEKYGGSEITLNKYYTTPTFTADPITKLTITASATNGIATDSRFTLYKLR